MLKCTDDTFYTGWTTDLVARVDTHNAGKGAKYTRCRLPVCLVYAEACVSKSAAMQREWAIKGFSRTQKMELSGIAAVSKN